MKIELRNLAKKYEGRENYTLENINLTINDKDFCVILGPSGCGKSTLLRMIAGLNSITKGDLMFDGIRVNGLDPKDRDIAMVFQSYALYPHMSIYKNIAFGLKVRKERAHIIDTRVKDVAKILKIQDYLSNKPSDISGGQRQRVALGRAIARKPKIFLMDEPLSNLDAKLREEMRVELVNIHRLMDATTIYVTHDQLEAMSMATKIVVMNNSVIQQVGTPRELYERPENLFVANFIGTPTMNFWEGKLVKNEFVSDSGKIKVELDAETIKNINDSKIAKITIGVRSENITVASKKLSGELLLKDSKMYNAIGEVLLVELLGKEQQLTANISASERIVVTVPTSINLDSIKHSNATEEMGFLFSKKDVHVFNTKTTFRIN